MKSDVASNSRETILAVATRLAQARGYGGLNFRDIAEEVGIRNASMYYHFPSKADLGMAVAKRYWEDSVVALDAILADAPNLQRCLDEYPDIFRRSLESDNRLCLGSFMSAEYDGLPETVKKEVQAFADVHVAWLSNVLSKATGASATACVPRARAIYAAVAGAQLLARSRSDIELFDAVVESYRDAGLFKA